MEYPTDDIEVLPEQEIKTWFESAKKLFIVEDINSNNWSLWSQEIKNIVRELKTKVRTELPSSSEEQPPEEQTSEAEKEEIVDDADQCNIDG